MSVLLATLTYFAYVFIIVMYAVKAIKIARMPVHLRWELYPVIHEPKRKYGCSYYEDLKQWTRHRHQTVLKGVFFLLRETFCLREYFHRNRGYWLVLLPWHIGFILIVTFHILCFLGALAIVANVPVSAESTAILGRILYFLILLTGVISFITGSLGSIGLVIKRLYDKDLRAFATLQNYFNYLFILVVFLSGLYAWYFVDPNFSEYLAYWQGLVTWNPIELHGGAATHIILFMLFLIYLPFTRSFHYISRLFAYFFIRWEDEPNLKGSNLEKRIQGMLGQRMTWAGPHIQTGKTWAEVATEVKFPEKK